MFLVFPGRGSVRLGTMTRSAVTNLYTTGGISIWVNGTLVASSERVSMYTIFAKNLGLCHSISGSQNWIYQGLTWSRSQPKRKALLSFSKKHRKGRTFLTLREEWRMYNILNSYKRKLEERLREERTSCLRFLRYFLLRLRYAFQTQFHPGVWLTPVAKKTTV
jgi:hypothetical protein